MHICSLIVAVFFWLNKGKEKQRVANGKPAKLTDRSMDRTYVAGIDDGTGANAFMDMTDKENDEVGLKSVSRLSLRFAHG